MSRRISACNEMTFRRVQINTERQFQATRRRPTESSPMILGNDKAETGVTEDHTYIHIYINTYFERTMQPFIPMYRPCSWAVADVCSRQGSTRQLFCMPTIIAVKGGFAKFIIEPSVDWRWVPKYMRLVRKQEKTRETLKKKRIPGRAWVRECKHVDWESFRSRALSSQDKQ